MKKSDFLTPAPKNYVWPLCPDADAFVRARVKEFLEGHMFARTLSERMKYETSTEFLAWVDALYLPAKSVSATTLDTLGYAKEKGTGAYWHPFADLPRIVLGKGALSCAIMVENITDFLLAHKLSILISGAPLSTYREARLPGEKGELILVERRGTRSFKPDNKNRAGDYLDAVAAWTNRPRRFAKTEEGMQHALKMAQQMVRKLGTGFAASAFLEAERNYWMSKNRAAQVQRARQDRLGLGWANHDHHTFRSSRPAFATLIKILSTFGFKKRERYYAGAEAGWGAQIMEQPEAKLIIFADVDLTADERTFDFSTVKMRELDKPGTVGLWCALHGESMLEAGMHHLEAKFDFELLREALRQDFNLAFMKPFSDFPHLRQAFSEGEIWRVPAERLDALKASGRISTEAYERIFKSGAVGSHMENLQRRDGFKGFNQRGVSDIIRAVNPEAQALKGTMGAAS